MNNTRSFGKKGEDLAATHLIDSGYRILRRNWTNGKNEIDIIAENEDFIVFVEVKTRSSDYLLHPRNAVSVQKQKSIINSAETFIKRFNINKECRFDIISIVTEGSEIKLDHLQDAFYPTLK